MRKDICFFCDEKRLCILEDIGGKIDADNKASVCLNCFIKDKLIMYIDGEIYCLKELEKAIIDGLETDFKLSRGKAK